MDDDLIITEIDDDRIATMIDETNVVLDDARFIGQYRRALLEEGFDEDVANEMCLMYHATFVCKHSFLEDDDDDFDIVVEVGFDEEDED